MAAPFVIRVFNSLETSAAFFVEDEFQPVPHRTRRSRRHGNLIRIDLSPEPHALRHGYVATNSNLASQSTHILAATATIDNVVRRQRQPHPFDDVSRWRVDVGCGRNFDGTGSACTQTTTVDEIRPSIVGAHRSAAKQCRRSQKFPVRY